MCGMVVVSHFSRSERFVTSDVTHGVGHTQSEGILGIMFVTSDVTDVAIFWVIIVVTLVMAMVPMFVTSDVTDAALFAVSMLVISDATDVVIF